MSQLVKALGRRRDLPQLEGINLNAQAAAGSGADYEHPISMIPNLASISPSGTAGQQPINAMTVREIYLIFEAAVTGVATNNFTLNINQRRAGAFLINTTASTAVASAGLAVITPASMVNIALNSVINVSGGTGTAEQIVVSAVTATTFSAVFANTHSGTYNLVSAPLATITFSNGVNASAYVPLLMKPTPNVLAAGDIVTIQRFSNGTGLASPALTIVADWDCA